VKPIRVVAVLAGASLLAMVLALSFAAIVNSYPAHSTISTGADGLRTFSIARGPGGGEILCTLGKPIPPVIGTLDGRAGASDPVWLVASDGHPMIVVWPAGFSVRFDPTVRLLNDRGGIVAQRGDTMELGNRTTDAVGTHDDPYIAAGAQFGGCYAYLP
jgi:hypothetical protein